MTTRQVRVRYGGADRALLTLLVVQIVSTALLLRTMQQTQRNAESAEVTAIDAMELLKHYQTQGTSPRRAARR